MFLVIDLPVSKMVIVPVWVPWLMKGNWLYYATKADLVLGAKVWVTFAGLWEGQGTWGVRVLRRRRAVPGRRLRAY